VQHNVFTLLLSPVKSIRTEKCAELRYNRTLRFLLQILEFTPFVFIATCANKNEKILWYKIKMKNPSRESKVILATSTLLQILFSATISFGITAERSISHETRNIQETLTFITASTNIIAAVQTDLLKCLKIILQFTKTFHY
jgi:hypothetical protein